MKPITSETLKTQKDILKNYIKLIEGLIEDGSVRLEEFSIHSPVEIFDASLPSEEFKNIDYTGELGFFIRFSCVDIRRLRKYENTSS